MMYVNFNLNKKQLEKLEKFKNPVLRLEKEMTNKDGKYVIPMSVALFNKLIRQGYINYKFTDSRKNKILQEGGLLGSILKMGLPIVTNFGKKLLPALAIGATGTLVNHGIKKSLEKKRGGSVNILVDDKLKKSIEQLYHVLKNQKVTLSEQNGGSILSILIPTVASLLGSAFSGKGLQIINQDF